MSHPCLQPQFDRQKVGRWLPPIRLAKLWFVLTVFFMQVFWTSAAQAVYVNRFSTTTNGAITFTGNTLGRDGSSASGTPGTTGSIGAFTTTNTALQFGTFEPGTTNNWTLNSSTAMLAVPAGSTVLYAELIWGGSYAYGGQNVAASLNNAITFATPSGTFSVAPNAATSQTLGAAGSGNCTTTPCRYVRSANVTALIQAAGPGTYQVGGVPATANTELNNNTAGWTLAVVYGNPSLPPRNLTVFVGAEAGGAAPTGVSGFCTNLAGPVKGRLLVSAMEGDASITGDQLQFGPTTGSMVALSGPNNALNNFFGSQINADSGALDTSGTAGTNNHNPVAGITSPGARQGYDISNLDVSAGLTNSQISAVAQGTTTGDQYTINALAMQIDVGAPKFPLTVKTSNRTITAVGDVVTYTVTLDNTAGTANASNVMFSDQVPPGMSFRVGTVVVNGIAQPSFDPLTGFGIGTINAGSMASVSFQVNVDAIPAAPALAQFVNRAKWTYDFISCAGFPAEKGGVETNASILPAVRLAPTKSVSPVGVVGIGSTLTYTITVPNTGLTGSTAATLTDLIPLGTTYVTGSTTLNGLPVTDNSGAMPYVTGTPISSPTRAAGVIGAGEAATVMFRVTVNAGAPAIITNSASIDPDGPGPAAAMVVNATNTPLSPPAASKAFAPTTVASAVPSILTVTINNANAVALTQVAFSDTLPAGLVIANPANVATTCSAGTALATTGGITLGLSNGTVPASSSCTVSAAVWSVTPGIYLNTIPVGGVSSLNGGSNTTAANASLTVLQGPGLTKAFSPTVITPNGLSTLTISLLNPTATALTAASVTDLLPSGLLIATTPAASTTCGGAVVAAPGSNSVRLNGGTIPPSSLCAFQVNVTASAIGDYTNIIPAAALSSSGGGNPNPAQADLSVTAPLVSKAFGTNPVAANTSTALTVTLINTTSTVITGAAFTDVFPTSPGAMTLANITTSNTCGGTLTNHTGAALAVGSAGIRLAGATIPNGGTCSVTVNVRASIGGNYLNTIPVGGVTSSNGGSNTIAANATLSVGLPGVRKSFGSIAVPLLTASAGATVPMAIEVTNPNPTAMPITTLTDLFPAGITLANTTVANTCGGTVTTSAGAALAIGSSGIRLNAGSIAANSSCTLAVNVRAASGGIYTNTIAAGQVVTTSGNNAFAANASLTVLAPPTVTKRFTAASISPAGTSLLTITLTNSNAQTLTGAAFTDLFPTTPGAMTLANLITTNTCGGTLADSTGSAITVGDTGLRLTAGSIPANGSCEITANVTASVVGTYTNTLAVAAVTTTNGGGNTSAGSAVLQVAVQPPTMTKMFATNPVGRNLATRLMFTISNPNASTALNAVQFTDSFPTTPGGMVVAPAPAASLSGCGPAVFSPASGAASISMTGASIAAGASCLVGVDVIAPVTGTYLNVSGAVSSSNGGNGGSASSTLSVLSAPIALKSFSVNPVNVGATTVLTISVSNPNATGTLNGVGVTDTYPTGLSNTGLPATAVSCSAGSSASSSGGAGGANTVGLSGATLAPGGVCSVTVNVSASTPGNIANVTGVVNSSNGGTGAAANSTLVVGLGVSGFVYLDNNSNSTKDGAEAGTGLSLYAKLIAAGVVQQTVAVNLASGAFGLVAVPPGTYNVIIDDNNLPGDLTPTVPVPWFGTETPAYVRAVTIGASSLINQNFGLSNGARISGRVFNDNGAGAGIANDGLINGGEAGIAGVALRLTDCAAATLVTAATDGAGNYSLLIPGTVSAGANLCVVQTNSSGFVSTGGSPGTTAPGASGAYNRVTDIISFVHAAGASYAGLNFGDVPVNTFSTDGMQTLLPGTSHHFAHTFVAYSDGLLSFTTSAVATPAASGWSEVLYRDSNCNGVLDSAEPVIAAPVAVTSGATVCVLVKEFVPAAAPYGAQNLVTITASFVYSNASPTLSASHTHTDTVTVGTPTSAGLALVKSVDKPTALPGDIITYTIAYRNDSSGVLTTLVINDATPAFTVFQAAACGPNPANITSCTLTSQPAVNSTGALVWTLGGGLLPGANSTVTFSVRLTP